MDRYTYETLLWLDLHFDPVRRSECGQGYAPYQPIDGIAPGRWTPQYFLMATRWARTLFHLRQLGARSFLDVGGAEGFLADLVRRVLGIDAVSLDLSPRACERAHEFFAIPAAAGEAHRLPFDDGAFDVVYLGEVIEHLAHPVRALLEAGRVARRAVLVTSEAYVRSEAERQRQIAERDAAPFVQPHMDRTFLTADDLEAAFAGWRTLATSQCARLPDPMPQDDSELAAALREALAGHDLAPPSLALWFVASRDGVLAAPDARIAADVAAVLERARPRTQRRHVHARGARVPDGLAAALRCPVTRERLARDGGWLVAPSGRRYAVAYGVPALLTPPGEDIAEPLAATLEAECRGDPGRAAALLALESRLRYELPAPASESVFLADGLGRWRLGPGLAALPKDGGGVVLTTAEQDPFVFSPRLDRPAASVRGITVELAVSGERPFEEVQVFWWTLTKPLWCEAASSKLPYRADASLHRLFLPFPPRPGFYPPDDQLLALRLDPSHGPSRAEIVRVVVEEGW